MGLAEWHQRKGQRCQKAESTGKEKCPRFDAAGDIKRQKPLQCRARKLWQDGRGHQPDCNTDRSGDHDLNQIDHRHKTMPGAEAFEGCNHRPLGIQMRLHRVGDANSADQKGAKPD